MNITKEGDEISKFEIIEENDMFTIRGGFIDFSKTKLENYDGKVLGDHNREKE
jgi:hypothetical protein